MRRRVVDEVLRQALEKDGASIVPGAMECIDGCQNFLELGSLEILCDDHFLALGDGNGRGVLDRGCEA